MPPEPGAGAQVPRPAVRLRRELKLPTVADLIRDDDAVRRLPGQARSALRHVQIGNLAAAETALPGGFAAVLPGPGEQRRARRRAARKVAVTLAILAAATLTFALWWCSQSPSG
ncbi:MAG: hypothetical protein IPK26_15780 [Planctomycetes bacterium]|nr:hypothetical protein [Planctomycetota bacterium]